MSAPKLSHVHLKVNKIHNVLPFYAELFDMKISEDLGSFVFLTNDETHHILALQESGMTFNPHQQKLYHIAFEVQTDSEFYAFAHKLKALQIPYQAVDHGISWAIYFNDPEGTGLELFLDRRSAPDGKLNWDGQTARLVIPD